MIPDYVPLLDAYHQAHRRTIRQAVETMPLRSGECVLDVPCGNGFYTSLLAERIAPHGKVIAADESTELLAIARHRHSANGITFEPANSYALPYDDGSFDFVWCAQSLISLRDIGAAMGEMLRVVKPGGIVAIWENDELHHTLLPWPPKLEIALYQAARSAQRQQNHSPDSISVGRFVRRHLREAGLANIVRHTFVTDHQQPLSDAARRFVECWIASLRDRLSDLLDEHQQSDFNRLTTPDSLDYLPNSADFEIACIDILTLGEKQADD